MKNLFVVLFVFGFALSSFADIQDPPSHDYGPTRKLGRGLSNMVWGWSEASVNIAKVSHDEGNAAGGGYGVVRGVGRSFARLAPDYSKQCSSRFPHMEEPISPSFEVTSRGSMGAIRNFHRSWVTNRNIRTCGTTEARPAIGEALNAGFN